MNNIIKRGYFTMLILASGLIYVEDTGWILSNKIHILAPQNIVFQGIPYSIQYFIYKKKKKYMTLSGQLAAKIDAKITIYEGVKDKTTLKDKKDIPLTCPSSLDIVHNKVMFCFILVCSVRFRSHQHQGPHGKCRESVCSGDHSVQTATSSG